MRKFMTKAMLTLVVFGMAIVSGFAMDTNPPTEPVKGIVETEVVVEVQPILNGYGYYNPDTRICHFLTADAPTDCSILNNGPQCTVTVLGITYFMFEVSRASESDPWICGLPIKEL